MSLTEIFAGAGILIAAVSTAYLAISRLMQENKEKQVNLDKAERNGVIQGEREYSERLEERIEEMAKEIKDLRSQVTELYDLVNKMQKTSIAKDETAAEQVDQIGKLHKSLMESKDETKEASVAAAHAAGEKAGAAGMTATATVKADVKDAVRDVLSENVDIVKSDVKEVKADVKIILDETQDAKEKP